MKLMEPLDDNIESSTSTQLYFFRRPFNIICDFDGTVTPFDVTDAILEKFALSEWREVEDEWVNGQISARECMRRQVALMRVARSELDVFLDSVPLVEGFQPFVDFCRSSAINFMVVSDGMDYAIRRILRRHGLGDLPLAANKLLFGQDGTYRLEFPFGDPLCGSGVCKCRVAGVDRQRILLIGDGRSDCCLAARASLVLAKSGRDLLEFCLSGGLPCLAYENFCDIRDLLGAWMSGEADSRALAV